MDSETRSMEKFGHTLKQLMKEKEVSAADVSKATGIPKSSLSEWISEGRIPKLDASIVKLAKFFGVPVEFLITGEHPEEAIVHGLLEDLEDGFVSIHKGVYRINVEKLTKVSKKKEKE